MLYTQVLIPNQTYTKSLSLLSVCSWPSQQHTILMFTSSATLRQAHITSVMMAVLKLPRALYWKIWKRFSSMRCSKCSRRRERSMMPSYPEGQKLENLLSWHHSGFHVYIGDRITPSDNPRSHAQVLATWHATSSLFLPGTNGLCPG